MTLLKRIIPRLRPLFAAATAAGLLASCSTLNYYSQAAQGQFELLSDARPIDDWIADPGTSSKLRLRLETARQIRHYAVAEMALPDNKSYKNYADVKRKYVLWNVVATPELSLKPLQWCFPVAGCVDYRGYYNKGAAEDYANQLRADGNDVEIGGVAAYSTLGWFNDPLISTFINYPDGELARMIFHELAHQVVYVPGDSQFNESFASTVEEVGVEQWLERFGSQPMRDSYARYRGRKKDFLGPLPAVRRANGRVATVAVNSFLFKNPVFVGDLLSFYADITKVGNTSITVSVEVYAERNRLQTDVVKVTEATLTYVATGPDRKPRQLPPLESLISQ
jgi:predicted aminopeptidase